MKSTDVNTIVIEPIEIAAAYDQISHLWDNPDFNRNNGIDAHQRAIALSQNKGKALDIGCGCTGRFIDLFIEQGFQPIGLDISPKMLSLAKLRHPQIEFIQHDICTYPLTERYDFISAWDSIWHIPLAEQQAVMTKIVKSLNPEGVFIFSFGALDHADEHIDDFMGPSVYYSTLGIQGFIKLFIDLGCQIRHFEYDQYPELHSYLIVQKS